MVKTVGVTVTGAQLRAARALIGMRAEDLAQESRVSLRTIRRAEQEDGSVSMTDVNTRAVLTVLEQRGIQLIQTEEGGFGVLLNKKVRRKDSPGR